MRLHARSSTDPRAAAATVEADTGVIGVRTPTWTAELAVSALRLDPHAGRCGQVAVLGTAGRCIALLDVEDWLSDVARVEAVLGSPDPRRWSGAQALADAARVPLSTGRLPGGGRRVSPDRSRRSVALLSLALGLLGPAWFVSSLLSSVRGEQVVVLLAALVSALLLADRVRHRAARLPEGRLVRPHPAGPAPRGFVRTAGIVVVPAGGPMTALAVRSRRGAVVWTDGPTRVVLVTPSGADRPSYVDLRDPLDRPVARLDWGQWWAGDAQGLDVLAAHGLPIEHATGPRLDGAAASGLMWPRVDDLGEAGLAFPGLLGPGALPLCLVLFLGPLVRGGSDLAQQAGVAVGVLTLVPLLLSGLRVVVRR